MILMDGFVESYFHVQSIIYSKWENKAQFIYNEKTEHNFNILIQIVNK
jgi:hypothetical protein